MLPPYTKNPSQPMKAMVLAAGFGTRLRPYSLQRPKPLFPILGKPLVLYTIEKLKSSGFSPIIVNAHHLAGQIVELLKDDNDVIVQSESTELGTGGGLRLATDKLGRAPVLIVNGDIFHSIDYCSVYEKHLKGNTPVSMVLHNYPRFNKVEVDMSGMVTGFSDDGNHEQGHSKKLAFTGIHVIDPGLLRQIPPGIFYNIIDLYKEHIGNKGKIKAIETDGYWYDIGTPADYLKLHADLLMGKLGNFGSGSADNQFQLGTNVAIGRNVSFSDWGLVGNNVKINDNVNLARVVVWDGARIPAGSNFTDMIIT